MTRQYRKTIIIVGGGYAGARLAKALDKVAKVTVVERRDRFLHNVAAIRAVTDPAMLDRILLPYDSLLTNGKVVRGEVLSVRSGAVTLSDERVLTSDYVVLAPGSSYAPPFKPRGDEGHESFRQRVQAIHDRLRAAKTVAIIGAGPVGIELAGEIRHAMPQIDVTLLSAQDRLLPGYSAALDRRLRRALADNGVRLMLGRRALDGYDAQEPFGPAMVRLEGAAPLAADLVFATGGTTPNTAFLQGVPGVDLSKGRIAVGPQLELPRLPGVFALGDAALTADTMTISALERQAPYLSRHLKSLIAGNGGQKAPYKAWTSPVLVVPVGPKAGASQLPASMVFGPWLTSLLKGNTLMIGKARKDLGLGKVA